MISKTDQILPGMVLETDKKIRYLYAQEALVNLNDGKIIELDGNIYDELYKTAQIERASITRIYENYLCQEVIFERSN